MKKNVCADKKSFLVFENLSQFLKIIGERNRLRILCLLKDGEMCVCDIYKQLTLSQNLTSSHLRVLKDFGLIKVRQEWKKNYYSIDKRNFKKYNSLFTKFIKSYEL